MTSTELRDKVQHLKNLILDDLVVRAWITSVWDQLARRLVQELSDPRSNARSTIHSAVLALARSMREDTFIRTRIDATPRNTVASMAQRDWIANR
jgi:uncharacterized membrane-anchored protein YjiN (DUF445 family)